MSITFLHNNKEYKANEKTYHFNYDRTYVNLINLKKYCVEGKNKNQLIVECKELGVKGYSKMKIEEVKALLHSYYDSILNKKLKLDHNCNIFSQFNRINIALRNIEPTTKLMFELVTRSVCRRPSQQLDQ